MRLSLHADYGLRVLLYLGAHPEEVVPTQRISDAYGISKHHLVRVVQTLRDAGYVRILPGRSGGVTLEKAPSDIRLGEVVRAAEPHLDLVECFDPTTNTCPILGACGLKRQLARALDAFLRTLDEQTLADLLPPARREQLARVFVQLRSPTDGD
jgi:Rrf2 family transcriptional regulator, nitric oxide-sensitive transcriptional repressor